MKIELSASHVRRRAAELYTGESLPISALTEGRGVLKPEWGTTNPQTESPTASYRWRQCGSISRSSAGASCRSFADPDGCGSESLRPDKAIIKVFLEEGLLTHRSWGEQLIFDLAPLGRRYLDWWESSGRVNQLPGRSRWR